MITLFLSAVPVLLEVVSITSFAIFPVDNGNVASVVEWTALVGAASVTERNVESIMSNFYNFIVHLLIIYYCIAFLYI